MCLKSHYVKRFLSGSCGPNIKGAIKGYEFCRRTRIYEHLLFAVSVACFTQANAKYAISYSTRKYVSLSEPAAKVHRCSLCSWQSTVLAFRFNSKYRSPGTGFKQLNVYNLQVNFLLPSSDFTSPISVENVGFCISDPPPILEGDTFWGESSSPTSHGFVGN